MSTLTRAASCCHKEARRHFDSANWLASCRRVGPAITPGFSEREIVARQAGIDYYDAGALLERLAARQRSDEEEAAELRSWLRIEDSWA